jgi:hypothetical protein
LISVSDARLRFLAADAFISFLDEILVGANARDPSPREKPAKQRLKNKLAGAPAETSLLTTEQAASKLGLAEGTLAKMRISGDGPLFQKLV